MHHDAVFPEMVNICTGALIHYLSNAAQQRLMLRYPTEASFALDHHLLEEILGVLGILTVNPANFLTILSAT